MSEMSTEVLEVKPKKPQTEGTKLSKAKYYQNIKNNEAYKEQIKKNAKKYYENHKDDVLNTVKSYYAKHREEILAYKKQYREAKLEDKFSAILNIQISE